MLLWLFIVLGVLFIVLGSRSLLVAYRDFFRYTRDSSKRPLTAYRLLLISAGIGLAWIISGYFLFRQ